MELPFPKDGWYAGKAYENQPATTSPNLMNVRPCDVEEDRSRGGKRPGFVLAYETQIGGEHPVVAIVQLATTYIVPES